MLMMMSIGLKSALVLVLLSFAASDGGMSGSSFAQLRNMVMKKSQDKSKASQDELDSMLQFMKEFGAANGNKTFKELVPEVQATFTEMVGLITDDIEPAIIISFQTAQSTIDTAYNALDSATTLATTKKGEADTADTAFDTCRGQEKTALIAHETCIGEQNALQADKETKCAAMLAAQVHQWQVPGGLTSQKSCDFLADPSGCADFTALETYVTDLEGAISVARADYVAKTAACNAATTLFDAKVVECDGLNTDYTDKRSQCDTALTAANVAKCTFGDRLQEKCEKLDDLNSHVTNITTGTDDTQSEASRIAEWDAAQTVKCILNSYVESESSFDETTQTQCEGNINYAGSVGVMDYKANGIASLTTPSNFECTETEITFSDATWVTGQTSADYNRTSPFADDVTLRPLGATFAAMC